jgi:hypothetical protein
MSLIRLTSVPPLLLRSISLPKYACLVCGKEVADDVFVRVFIAPGDGSYRPGAGVPFTLDISPCCGDRACVEAAWERAKAGVLGEIEIEEMELEAEGEEEAPIEEELTPQEKRLLDAKDEEIVKDFLEWADKSREDPHDYYHLLRKFLEEAKGFPKLGDSSYYGDLYSPQTVVTQKVNSLRHSIARALEGRDMKLADLLVSECLAWAGELGLNAIRKTEVEVFLREKGLRLDRVALQALWTKVSLQLRVSKGSK